MTRFVAVLLFAVLGCTPQMTSTTVTQPPSVNVSVTPSTVTLTVGQTQLFTATVTGSTNASVTWSVTGGSANGTITAAGVYTTPNTPGTYFVVATPAADSLRAVSVTVSVLSNVTITISPNPAPVVCPSAVQQFTATVTGTTDTRVLWALRESVGVIDQTGRYTAPPSGGTYRIMATSLADTRKIANLDVTVGSSCLTVVVSPATASVDACKTQQFTATYTGTTDTRTTWSAPDGGTVSATGLFTAPSTGGSYRVVGTSVLDSSRASTATVTVTERVLSVSVSPPSVTLPPNGTAQFTATVTTTCGSTVATTALQSFQIDGKNYLMETTGSVTTAYELVGNKKVPVAQVPAR